MTRGAFPARGKAETVTPATNTKHLAMYVCYCKWQMCTNECIFAFIRAAQSVNATTPDPVSWVWRQARNASDWRPHDNNDVLVKWQRYTENGQATITDVSLHTFRPCLPRPSFLSNAGNRKVCNKFDTWRGPLFTDIPSESPTAKEQCNIFNAKFP